ncbi:MAG: tRNA (adenosine(37)-N6)-threonylcarbamoyltransferase complex transferase subunit TsaD [Dehalococcoidales bacterium]|jgi:N6-L-threonylcarbamoyladenine synthase|nr:tRNA (adenosine(37)-N6)-threonylcarbamoyltransferase complex transferase subunit TsaD [Dehalococcoidales bacterium]
MTELIEFYHIIVSENLPSGYDNTGFLPSQFKHNVACYENLLTKKGVHPSLWYNILVILLGIETSCDETAAAVVENGRHILSSVVSSQIDIHSRFGGVVPEIASRQHISAIIPVIDEALSQAHTDWNELDAIATTHGPGLAGSLLVGANTAKAISFARKLPLVGVNHLEAHIYANWLSGCEPEFPLLCLIVSGGHTDLILMKNHGDYTLLGKTRDDAAGEAFDKAARILGLSYPGGPAIDNAARNAIADIKLPRAWLRGTDDFSFSGLKTALLRLVEAGTITSIENAAASFQEAVVDVLVKKTINAAVRHRVMQILLSGGVAANSLLREQMTLASPIPVLIPSPSLCTDNAAMVAACGYYRLQRGCISGIELDVIPSMALL